jgi:uncharacterized protein
VVEKAGEFADTFALRAYDAVQLVAAHPAMAVSDEPLVFGCFDARLKKPRVCSGWKRASVVCRGVFA